MSQNDPIFDGKDKDVKISVIPEGQAFILALLAGGVPAQLTSGTPGYFLYSELSANWKQQASQAVYQRTDGTYQPAFNIEDPYLGGDTSPSEPAPEEESEKEEEDEDSGDGKSGELTDVIVNESGENPTQGAGQESGEPTDPIIVDEPQVDPVGGSESPDAPPVAEEVPAINPETPAVDPAQSESSDAPTAPVIDEGAAAPEAPVKSEPLTAEQLGELNMADLREVGQKFEVKDSSKDGLIEKILAAQAALAEKEAAASDAESKDEEETGSDE